MYKKLIIASFFSLLIWISAEHTMLRSILANTLKNPMIYPGGDEATVRYNQALYYAQGAQYDTAKSLLRPILNTQDLPYSDRVFELYGDTLYLSSGTVDDVLFFYKKSLTIKDTPRVQLKIQYLESMSKNTDTQSTTLTGATERDDRRQEIREARQNTLQERDIQTGIIPGKDLIDRTLQILSPTTAPMRDW